MSFWVLSVQQTQSRLCSNVRRALHARKKMGGDNMPVQMIGDILAAELSHMQPYIRFCSCQINGASLLQIRIDNEPDFKDFLKVGGGGVQEEECAGGGSSE